MITDVQTAAMKGLISNIQRFSVNDGPGIRTTVFLKGCPLRCAWCHNPELISTKKELLLRSDRCIRCGDCMAVCANNAVRRDDGEFITVREACLACGSCIEVCFADGRQIVGREMATTEVVLEIEKDTIFFDQSGGGVTFSGGEPFLQHDFLLSLAEACKGKRIHTAVDTSGYVSSGVLERTADSVDLFLYDLKSLDDEKHREFTGVSNRLVLENLRLLAQSHHHVIVRIPVIPGFNDELSDIRRIASFVESLHTVREIHLLPYHKTGIHKYCRVGLDYRMHAADSPSADLLDHMVRELGDHSFVVSIEG